MGPQLCEKAKVIAEHLGISNFKASNGWLDRWKRRYNVKKVKINGEAGDVRGETVHSWMERLPERGIRVVTSGILMKQLAFGKLYPIMALERKDHSAKVAKKPSSCRGLPLPFWLTQMERRKLRLSFENPRCFKGMDKTKLPVQYFSQPKGWMAGDILDKILSKWNRKLRSTCRSVVLLMDNILNSNFFINPFSSDAYRPHNTL